MVEEGGVGQFFGGWVIFCRDSKMVEDGVKWQGGWGGSLFFVWTPTWWRRVCRFFRDFKMVSYRMSFRLPFGTPRTKKVPSETTYLGMTTGVHMLFQYVSSRDPPQTPTVGAPKKSKPERPHNYQHLQPK